MVETNIIRYVKDKKFKNLLKAKNIKKLSIFKRSNFENAKNINKLVFFIIKTSPAFIQLKLAISKD